MKSIAIFAIVAAGLAGCAAKNPILRKSEWDQLIAGKPDPGSMQFSLPRARLEITHTELTESFKAGPFTSLVEGCLNGGDANIPGEFCDDLHRMGLGESRRLSVQPRFKNVQCDVLDAGKSEIRVSVSVADSSVAYVADPDQLFVVPLKRNYFQSSDIQMNLNALGSIESGTTKTENLGASETLTAITSLISGFAARQGLFSKIQSQSDAKKTLNPLVQQATVVLSILKDSEKLAANGWKEEIVRNEFLGTLTEATIVKKTLWIPVPESTQLELAKFNACGISDSADTRVLVRVDQIQPTVSNSVSTPAREAKTETLGWPYRVPKEMRVVSLMCDQTCTDIKAQLIRLPQFGAVYRLPAKTGGKTSSIAPTYHNDGSIDELKILNTGESPSPIVSALKAALTPAPVVTEKAELESLTELIKARQALCRIVRKVDDKDPICQGANPPTNL